MVTKNKPKSTQNVPQVPTSIYNSGRVCPIYLKIAVLRICVWKLGRILGGQAIPYPKPSIYFYSHAHARTSSEAKVFTKLVSQSSGFFMHLT